ncbi:mitochondrial ribonuclease P protein 1 homolog [Uranotaenia lowii]|uniref:mitochondrial ribonuclease P protein 1 homolog n=1 Tax=Uranotaenia lowii TaxID=190385 RepID=UPI00247AC1E3|nr:mitochondrial ribonuclease P protein 1 homolog [Uranotaenia lowii]
MLRTIFEHGLIAAGFLKSAKPHRLVYQTKLKPAWTQMHKHYANLPNSDSLVDQSAEKGNQESDVSFTPSETDIDKKRKILELEMEVMRQEGRKVPTPAKIKEQYWQHLLGLGSRNQRRNYYLYLWNIEMSKENQRIKKEQRKVEVAKRREELDKANADNDHIIYGLFHNTMFLRIYDTAIDHFHNNKLIQAMRFGQNLVFDCSYDEYMNEKEMKNTAKQLMLCFAINRMHNEPFNIHHCNVNFNKTTMKALQKHLVQIHEPHFPINVSEKSYLDLFPKERLVYLTPHCKNDLECFDPDDVYIVGAMVDKTSQEAISLGKAKKQGLRMARLPLDQYFQFKSGKSLTIDQMLQILLELKSSNNFEKALEYVPKRKVISLDEARAQQQQRTIERKQMEKFKFSVRTFSDRKYNKR